MEWQKWQEINRILKDVLAIEPRKRLPYLENLSIDEETREEIESLISFQDETDLAFDLSALELSKVFIETEKTDLLIGQQIGVYEIVSVLGYGGMGAVYLAKRNDKKFDQQVAIKMLRQEFNTKKIRSRFKREREIQAALVHPNVATLLDAGTTDFGIPFLVMEYVEGSRIDKYCFENNLKLNDRLKLFNKVCDAVSAAHRNLIIHRDIKPSNIIVSPGGEPKLLDFGISKLIDKTIEHTKTVTQIGAMTPEYASPEQVRGKSVTTATDVYSLGVLLFKLLTGELPYDTEGKPDAKIFAEITNSQPKTPSEINLKSSQSVIRNSQLKGDLDNIILKSLRKKPERRYRSVEEFSADIWQFIDGLPVSARPATFLYKATKFYKRNKIQVLAGTLVLVSLVTGITVAFWQRNIALQQAQNATKSQLNAEVESAKSKKEEERAKEITAFMMKIIAYANPGGYAEGFESKGEAKVIDVLNEMSNKIESDFPDRIDIQAELHHKFAEVYVQRTPKNKSKKYKSEEYRQAVNHATRAIELRKKYYGDKHELVAKDMYYLWATRESNNTGSNSILLAEAIQMMRETNAENLNLPYMLLDYGSRIWTESELYDNEMYYKNALPRPKAGKLELAEQFVSEAILIAQKAYPNNKYLNHNTLCQRVIINIEMQEFVEAKNNMRHCDEFYKKINSENSLKWLRKYKLKLAEGLKK